MKSLTRTLASLTRLARSLPQNLSTNSHLAPLRNFGSNPGKLGGWVHVPDTAAANAPLVVVLHGCTQNAASYDESSGWSRLADRHGFVVLYPEQQRSNNPNLCFNWFSPEDVTRDQGEALSIRQMVDAMVAAHGTDPRRTYITGLSAGGAMAASMLAVYPDVFAGGAVIAGLPFGVARSVPEAYDRMQGRGGPGGATLTNLVRAATDHSGNWPVLSVWHGSADETVAASNAAALVEQWRGLHGVAKKPDKTETVAGHPRRVWTDAAGREVIEEYRVLRLGHGTPLDAVGSSHGESAAPFMLDAGISSTALISDFWGIVQGEPAVPVRAASPQRVSPAPAARTAGRTIRSPQTRVGDVIEDALRAAGLMK